MSTIQVNTDKINTREEAYNLFKEKNLNKGDKIEVLTDKEKFAFAAIMALILIAVVVYFMRELNMKKNFGKKVLDDLFANKSDEELEKEIEQEYGIDIEVEKKKQKQDDWYQFTEQGLANAYGEDEPDYSEVSVQKRNPDYKGPNSE